MRDHIAENSTIAQVSGANWTGLCTRRLWVGGRVSGWPVSLACQHKAVVH